MVGARLSRLFHLENKDERYLTVLFQTKHLVKIFFSTSPHSSAPHCRSMMGHQGHIGCDFLAELKADESEGKGGGEAVSLLHLIMHEMQSQITGISSITVCEQFGAHCSLL